MPELSAELSGPELSRGGDTIAAVATASGAGAIGIVRMSGADAFAIAGSMFRGKKRFDRIKSHTVSYGFIVDAGDAGVAEGAGDGGPGGSDGPSGPGGSDGPGEPCGSGGSGGPDGSGIGDTGFHGSGFGGGDSGFGDSGFGSSGLAPAEKLDEVLLIKMKAPRTYTREDVVEIHCHAGPDVTQRVLRLALRKGARAAEPGEFTKRAFLNGRLDLTQAEAVMDIIASTSEMGTRAALKLLEGGLRSLVGDIRGQLLDLIASLDVCLDFPEYSEDQSAVAGAEASLREMEGRLSRLADSHDRGRAAREGLSAAIVGKPNVGKSTLLNALAGGDRAIVTSVPGTTRDVISEYVNLGGYTVRFSDTAGIRETGDAIESIGVRKSLDALEVADLAIAVLDASEGEGALDGLEAALGRLRGKWVLALINKTDLSDAVRTGQIRREISERFAEPPFAVIEASLASGGRHVAAGEPGAARSSAQGASGVVQGGAPAGGSGVAQGGAAAVGSCAAQGGAEASEPGATRGVAKSVAQGGAGIAADDPGAAAAVAMIGEAIKEMLCGGAAPGGDYGILTNERQHALIQRCLASIRAAGEALRGGLPPEMPIIDMEDALSALREISGDAVPDDVIDRIFSNFCVGK